MKPVFVDRHSPWVVFFLGVLFLMPGIWSESGITGQDEYWLSLRTPMETLERGTWFTPWVNDQPRLRKPPLLYWAILLNYKLFGIHLFSARIWGVLAGAGLATCSTLLYRELFRKSGLLAGLITLSIITVAIEGRRAMLDLPMAFFTAVAVLFALKWGKTERTGLDSVVRIQPGAFLPRERTGGTWSFCRRLLKRPFCIRKMALSGIPLDPLSSGPPPVCLCLSAVACHDGLSMARFSPGHGQ